MVHIYTAEVIWERGDQAFADHRYSRRHTLQFDGGVAVAGSASPLIVPVPFSDPCAVDPEESLVSAIASCHMLWFLSVAANRGFIVDFYRDHATAVMTRNESQKYWMSTATLRPQVVFSGTTLPTAEQIAQMHDEAHAECFIANSVKTAIQICPQ